MVGLIRRALREMGITLSANQARGGEEISQPPESITTVAGVCVNLYDTAAADNSPAQGSETWRDALTTEQKRSVFHPVKVERVELKPQPCVMVSLTLPERHGAVNINDKKKREIFWQENCTSTLPIDGVVCFVKHGQALLLGTVVSYDLC